MIDIRLASVTKSYSAEMKAVDAIDLEVEHGSLVTLVGPSGCGKTTTLKMISGFESITAGDIYVGEERINNIPAHRRDVTTVFQNYALFPHMKVRQNVAYGLVRRGTDRDEIRRKMGDMLDVVGLTNFADRYPSELSGGQQQRVALARSLVLQPRVLLLDEPLSNLDAKLRKRMEVEIRQILHENNVTAIHVTHDQEEALTMSDQVAVMNQGRIEQIGSPTEVYRRPTNRWVAQFIGISNLLPMRDAQSERAGWVQGVLDGGTTVASRAPHDVRPDQPLWLMIRPEALRVRSEPSASGTVNHVHGRVRSTLYLGRCARLEVGISGSDVDATVLVDVTEEQDAFSVGDDVYVEWDPSASWVLAT